jgi:GNAT superfamily N-acetyltransferase
MARSDVSTDEPWERVRTLLDEVAREWRGDPTARRVVEALLERARAHGLYCPRPRPQVECVSR